MQRLLSYVLDFIFPPRCPLCRCYTDEQAQFCPECLRRILCVRRVPLNHRAVKNLRTVYALTHYHGGADKLISELKYRKDMRHLPHIHALISDYMTSELAPDCVVPVPLYRDKLHERGFNQAEKLFAPWSGVAGWRWCDGLERHRSTLPQYTLDAASRRQNLKDAFSVKHSADFRGQTVLLTDDIFTTGTTMDACANVLRHAGAAYVDGLVFASDA